MKSGGVNWEYYCLDQQSGQRMGIRSRLAVSPSSFYTLCVVCDSRCPFKKGSNHDTSY